MKVYLVVNNYYGVATPIAISVDKKLAKKYAETTSMLYQQILMRASFVTSEKMTAVSTQPIMTRKISNLPRPGEIFSEKVLTN